MRATFKRFRPTEYSKEGKGWKNCDFIGIVTKIKSDKLANDNRIQDFKNCPDHGSNDKRTHRKIE